MKKNRSFIGIFIIHILIPFLGFGQSVSQDLQTEPPQTTLIDGNDKEIASSPFSTQVFVPEQKYSISKKGYQSVSIELKKDKKGLKFPDDIKRCEPCLMEFNQRPLSEGINPMGKIKLRKSLTIHQNALLVSIATPRLMISPESVVAKINGHKIKLNDKEIHMTLGYVQNMSNSIENGFDNTYIDASDLDSHEEEKTRLFKPKIVVRPLLKNIEYNLDGKVLQEYIGTAYLECDWQFFNYNDTVKILGTITTKTSLYIPGNNNDLPVYKLICEAAKDLVTVDSLYNFIQRVEHDYLNKTMFKPFQIKPGSVVKFNSQKEMLKLSSKSVVTVENNDGFGSGVIIDPSGIILTSHHVVIDDTAHIKVKISGKEELLSVTVLALNSDFDLALLKLPPDIYPAIPFSVDDSLETGDIVYAVGTPLDKTLGQSVTKGIVSGFRYWSGVNFIQTDVSINSGNSGGPLLTEEGKISGITTMKVSGKGIEGVGFCIPTSTIIKALNLKF